MAPPRKPARGLGRDIQQLREARGLSTTLLAGLAGLSQVYLQQVENGTKEPTLGALRRVAEALHADLVLTLRPKSGALPRPAGAQAHRPSSKPRSSAR